MQATRGTSLSSQPALPHPRTRSRLVFWGVALAAYAVDVSTKQLALHHVAPGERIRLLGEVLQLTLVRNPGAAFSTGTRFTFLFSALAIAAVVFVLWLSRRVEHRGWALAFGLLLAGVAGNLTDRLFRDPGPLRGHVVDFLALPHWPVFNVADMCIDAAAGLMILLSFRGIALDGRRLEERAES